MLHIFEYDNANGLVKINKPEILLIEEFAKLMDDKRNICAEDKTGQQHLRAFREFTYIWLAIDWESFYNNDTEQVRHLQALKDSGLTEDEFNNPEFRAACRKYRSLQESNLAIRSLSAAKITINKFIDYFESLDPQERDEQTGKPIYKVKDIMAEITSLSKVLEELKILEGQAKKEMQEQSQIRAGAVEGFEDYE